MSTDYYVAWWNVENLFDIDDAPFERRPDEVRRASGTSSKGRTVARLDRKVDHLARIIAQMNAGARPDLLRVCEVENRFVLDLSVENVQGRLPGRVYDVAHADTDDAARHRRRVCLRHDELCVASGREPPRSATHSG